MLFYCVEPAHDALEKKTAFYDWKFTLREGFSHFVAFPHVDSCLGVVCKLKVGRVFSGHINGFYKNDFSAQSHQAAFQALVDEIGDAHQVSHAAVFGDVANWQDMGVVFPWNNLLIIHANSPSGVDALLDVDMCELFVMGYQPNREFRLRVHTNRKWQGKLGDQVGRKTVYC